MIYPFDVKVFPSAPEALLTWSVFLLLGLTVTVVFVLLVFAVSICISRQVQEGLPEPEAFERRS